ncbi:MAG: hypothetical protein QM702_03165 [Rubrivivax sp.]
MTATPRRALLLAAAALAAALAGWAAWQRPAAEAVPAPAAQAAPAAVPPVAAAPAASRVVATPPRCALQSLVLTPAGGEPATVCMDATRVQQTGSVRRYELGAADADGWRLAVETVQRRATRVTLQALDGRRYACDAGACAAAVQLDERASGQARALVLSGLRLAAATGTPPAELRLDARLAIPPDDQLPGLACSEAGVTMQAADGSSQRFCGQGGSGVELADDGQRHYRFEDHEGRTLRIDVDAAERVTGVDWAGHGCRGAACTGAGTQSAEPANALAQRRFSFGRTPLYAGAGSSRPTLVLDGTLVMPGQP